MNRFKEITLRRSTLLIVLSAVLVIALGLGYIFTPKLMASSIGKQEQSGNTNTSIVLKERLIRFFPGSEEAREEVYALAEKLLQQEGRIMIGPDFTSGGAGVGGNLPVTLEEVILYLERVAPAQNEMWKYNCYEKLAELYRLQGDYSKAEENYLVAAQGFRQGERDYREAEANRSLADMYLKMGEGQKALDLINKTMQVYPKQTRGDFLAQKGDAYLMLEDYAQAEQFYREALAQAEKDWDNFQAHLNDQDSKMKETVINATLEDQPVYSHSKSRLDLLAALSSEGAVKTGQVKGEILAGLNPLADVMVYLLQEGENDGMVGNFERIAALPPVRTDERGGFAFSGVAPGRYYLVLGLKPEDLEGLGRYKGLEVFTVEAGKTSEQRHVFHPRVIITEPSGQQGFKQGEEFNLKWQEVPQALSYNLHLTLKLDNGYVSRIYREKLENNYYSFHPQGLNIREIAFVTWGDKGGLNPSAILGSFYPGAEIYFVVEALDSDGRPISDSEGYVLQLNGNYPSVLVGESEENPMSPGDKLVLERKYPEALQAYQEELAERPSAPETLLSLARIYNHYELTQENYPDTGMYTAEHRKALEYYRQLLKVSREKFVIEETASCAVLTDDDLLALELFEEIEEEFAENSFWYHLMGELYFKTGQTAKALPYYLKYLKGQKEFRDLGPVIALLYEDNVNGAINLLRAKEYSQRARHSSEGEDEQPADITTLLASLERYKQGTPSTVSREDFRKLLLEVVSIDGRDRFSKVKAFQAKARALGENDVLVTVLAELAQDRL